MPAADAIHAGCADILCPNAWPGAARYEKDVGAVIGTGAVATKDVEPYSVVIGVPAEKIRMRFPSDLVERTERSEWWNWDYEVLKARLPYFRNMDPFADKYLNPSSKEQRSIVNIFREENPPFPVRAVRQIRQVKSVIHTKQKSFASARKAFCLYKHCMLPVGFVL